MLNETDILLNKAAQGKISIDNIASWFQSQDSETKKDIILLLKFYRDQAVNSGKINVYTTEKEIPSLETFTTLMTEYKIADTKRRNTQCLNGCTHEWHNIP